MNMNIVLKVLLAIVVVWLAIRIVTGLLGIVMTLVHTAITLAIIVGVIWLVMQIFSARKAY